MEGSSLLRDLDLDLSTPCCGPTISSHTTTRTNTTRTEVYYRAPAAVKDLSRNVEELQEHGLGPESSLDATSKALFIL